MNLTLGQLRSRVEQLYPGVQEIGNTVLRYTRSADQSQFAVYYLDISKDLPSTPGQLNEYLDRVVGAYYFEGKSSLQWNNYLYFIMDAESLNDSATRKAIEFVERDRTYARKFVIAETELDRILKPQVVRPSSDRKQADVIPQWMAILKEPHLIDAVIGNYTLPQRMKLIEDGGYSPSPKKRKRSSPQAIELLPPIRTFTIKKFRPYPMQRNFTFGDVNLLFGVNGSGKTSLLEAIELYYCGKTKRNPKPAEEYEFDVFADGKQSETVTHGRSLQMFRDCHLAWYGTHEEKTANLYDGFGRFNFLDTDAAVELSESTSGMNDDLARLLIGSDAAKTWHVIEALDDHVSLELRAAESIKYQVSSELELIKKQLIAAGTVKQQSDLIRASLKEMLDRNQWIVDDHDWESGAGELAEQLSTLIGVARQATSLFWLGSPVTLDSLDQYCRSADAIIQTCTPIVDKLESLRNKQLQLTEVIKRSHQSLNLVGELARIVESGIEGRESELVKSRGVITSSTHMLVGIDDEMLKVLGEANGGYTVSDYRDWAISARQKAETSLHQAREEYDAFARLRDSSISLAQELRQVAARILEKSPSDECPLCHTKFTAGELSRQIAMSVDENLETVAQKLLGKSRRLEADLIKAVAIEGAAIRITAFCVSARLPTSTDIKDAMAKLVDVQRTLRDTQKLAENIVSEINSLKSQGLSRERLDEICAQLGADGYKVTLRSRDEIKSLGTTIGESVKASLRQMETIVQEDALLRTTYDNAIRAARPTASDPQRAIAELNERLATAQKIQSIMTLYLSRYNWDRSSPIAGWIVEAESVRGIAVQLQTILGSERVMNKTHSDTVMRKDELQKQEIKLTARIKRLRETQAAIKEIRTNRSLEAVTLSALQEIGQDIETIFTQIHSPAEFKGIGENWTLIRKLGNEETPLTKISTGQRSAFAISIFLAQNAQLKVGPPVILIDDPIAHVDDLNALSFLDYLREIALTGKRQIFIATASDKLASLFERKFEFLGNRFRRFNLIRNPDFVGK